MFYEEESVVYENCMQSLSDIKSKITSAEEKSLEQEKYEIAKIALAFYFI